MRHHPIDTDYFHHPIDPGYFHQRLYRPDRRRIFQKKFLTRLESLRQHPDVGIRIHAKNIRDMYEEALLDPESNVTLDTIKSDADKPDTNPIYRGACHQVLASKNNYNASEKVELLCVAVRAYGTGHDFQAMNNMMGRILAILQSIPATIQAWSSAAPFWKSSNLTAIIENLKQVHTFLDRKEAEHKRKFRLSYANRDNPLFITERLQQVLTNELEIAYRAYLASTAAIASMAEKEGFTYRIVAANATNLVTPTTTRSPIQENNDIADPRTETHILPNHSRLSASSEQTPVDGARRKQETATPLKPYSHNPYAFSGFGHHPDSQSTSSRSPVDVTGGVSTQVRAITAFK